MLLTARKMLVIHVLMRLPDFVKPVMAAADRFVQRIQKAKLFLSASCLAVASRTVSVRRSDPRHRGCTYQSLPRAQTEEG